MDTTQTTTPLEEVFLLPLSRAELELVEAEISVMYAIELAKQHPPFLVLTSEGAEPYPEWLARLGAREVAKSLLQFVETRGVDGMRDLATKLHKLRDSRS